MSLWDLVQHVQIREAREEAEAASAKVGKQVSRMDLLQGQMERLTLINQALWELLRERHELTDDHLRAKILEVDARDGTVDGKMGHEVLACPSCGQRTSTRSSRCIFCGETVSSSNICRS